MSLHIGSKVTPLYSKRVFKVTDIKNDVFGCHIRITADLLDNSDDVEFYKLDLLQLDTQWWNFKYFKVLENEE